MYTSISFPNGDEITQDEDGFVTHNKTYIKNIPAVKKDTTRTDEIAAHQMGYSVSCIFEIDVVVQLISLHQKHQRFQTYSLPLLATTKRVTSSMSLMIMYMTSNAHIRKRNHKRLN